MSVFEFAIAMVIIVAAPIVFWFFYSIIALRLGWEPRKHDYLPDKGEEVHCASAGDEEKIIHTSGSRCP